MNKPNFIYRMALVCVLALVWNTSVLAEVKVADPLDYKPTPDAKLGVNENGKGLEPGTHIEDIVLKAVNGEDYQLSDAWKSGPALVVFYRGGWCPYCNTQVRELSVRHDDFVKAGVQPVLISVDTPDNAAMVSAQYDIPFPVLSDPDLAAHKLFNVVLELDDETLAQYKQYGLDLSQWSGADHNAIAVASAFLIDSSGNVVMSHAPEDYSQRPSVDQLLSIIGK